MHTQSNRNEFKWKYRTKSFCMLDILSQVSILEMQLFLTQVCIYFSDFLLQIKEIDCKDVLDMICNLESEENEKGALSLCTAFFKRQLLQGDVYCAWYDPF